MRFWPLALLALGGLGFALPGPKPAEEWTFILGGDTDGYLSPCGCTKPMSGGIRRRATAVRSLRKGSNTVVLENGGFVATAGRQDELKAEALAEAMAAMDATAVHYTPAEAKLGRGLLMTLSSLSDGRLVSSHLSTDTPEVRQHVVSGPFLIGGVSSAPDNLAAALSTKVVPAREATSALVSAAKGAGLEPVLMLRGSLSDAEALAKEFPELRLIQYRAIGDPPAQVKTVGKTVLATPGDKNKHIVRLSYRDGAWSGYRTIRLAPEYVDDPAVARFYRTYLKRVDEEDLLEKLPRASGPAYAGSATCGKCHTEAMRVTKASEHFHALDTLEKEWHDRDPDCTGCHVTGLESTSGFKARNVTPDLAHVGCESCHGPGASHAADPANIKLPADATASCGRCHTGDTSPGFEFSQYWQKIRHK